MHRLTYNPRLSVDIFQVAVIKRISRRTEVASLCRIFCPENEDTGIRDMEVVLGRVARTIYYYLQRLYAEPDAERRSAEKRSLRARPKMDCLSSLRVTAKCT
jgi:hypothetical protein